MIYSILKTIIDTTIVQYICQNCSGKIDENSVSIGEATDNQIHLDITCPHCQAQAHIHAEVANVQPIGGQHQVVSNQEKKLIPKNENALKEIDIQNVEKSLETIQSVEDLLK
jgi:DNA-directed RNA polymerase subunit RPC12/RpoP